MIFLDATNQQGVLRFSSPTNDLAQREVKLTEVEGRWVPADMAANWEAKVEQAKTNLAKLRSPEFEAFKEFKWPRGMKLSQIPQPSQTITFGEKRTGSPHAYMDFHQGVKGNDLEELEHGRHGGGKDRRAGYSNYSFADGRVSSLKFGMSVTPVNLWAVTDEWRSAPPVPLDNVE